MARMNKYLKALQKPRPSKEMLRNSELLFEAAQQLNLQPHWENDYGLFSVQRQGKTIFLFHTFSVINSQAASVFAKNKHITRLIIAKAGLLNIPFCLPKTKSELKKFFSQHRPIIAKPMAGTNSWNVFLIKTAKELAQVPFKQYYFEKFFDGIEYRYLVLNQQVIYIQERVNQPIKSRPWHKLKQSVPQTSWTQHQKSINLALKIAQLMNLNFCAVDFIKKDGVDWLLEVNASPGLAELDPSLKTEILELAQQYLKAYLKGLVLV